MRKKVTILGRVVDRKGLTVAVIFDIRPETGDVSSQVLSCVLEMSVPGKENGKGQNL